MITADIDTQAYIYALDLHLFRNIKEVRVDQDLPKVVGYHYIGFVILPS